jgi:hypothetical protein
MIHHYELVEALRANSVVYDEAISDSSGAAWRANVAEWISTSAYYHLQPCSSETLAALERRGGEEVRLRSPALPFDVCYVERASGSSCYAVLVWESQDGTGLHAIGFLRDQLGHWALEGGARLYYESQIGSEAVRLSPATFTEQEPSPSPVIRQAAERVAAEALAFIGAARHESVHRNTQRVPAELAQRMGGAPIPSWIELDPGALEDGGPMVN